MSVERARGGVRTKRKQAEPGPQPSGSWTFLTNHAHVVLCLALEPDARMRDVAALIGITERAVQRIVSDLEKAGYVVRHRDGRRNTYEVMSTLPLRHPIEQHCAVSSLLKLGLAPSSRQRLR